MKEKKAKALEKLKRTSLDYASPLKNRTLLQNLKEKGESVVKPFCLLYDKTMTQAGVGEKVFARFQATGSEIPFYRLSTVLNEQGEKRYQLRSNKDDRIVTPNSKYSYVVISNQTGEFELRIGNMHHHYLANKKIEVYAAGEIFFDGWDATTRSADILKINPCSGGYHTDEEEELVRAFKNCSIQDVLEKVGLPKDKFQPYIKPEDKRRHSFSL
ncbi:hypothetical protein [Candidatus Berkiella aquae]|uniref:Uncharacterized protein n=1 Tax=Candidatus Berkiella aquae TaxID=295108 RepID=A0A0Q9Z0I1_9GAMM|nr:hypothetical protein [Candidatus Berkiella aquae]MCS5711873.1 hypothetical protein [Candidatus Berkiella aquae]